MTDDPTPAATPAASDSPDARWERPARTRSTERKGGRRRAAPTEGDAPSAEASPAAAAAAPEAPAAAPEAAQAPRGRRPRPTPVPRDVPCEWTPPPPPAAPAVPATPPAAPRAESPRVNDAPATPVSTAAPLAPLPRSEVPRAEGLRPEPLPPRAEFDRRDPRGDGSRGDGGRNDPYRADGARNDGARNDGGRNDGFRADAGRGDGQRNDGPRPEGPAGQGGGRPDFVRNDRNEFRRDRFNRQDRFNNRDGGQGQGGQQSGGQPHQGGQFQGGQPQQGGQFPGGQQRHEFRRLSRHEMRRLSRRDRMMLRQQEDPYDPQALAAAPSGEPRPDAPPPLRMSALQALEVPPLLAQAEELGIVDDLASLGKHDIVYELLRHHARRGGLVVGEGILELMTDGFGYLRNPYNDYSTCPEDPCVLPAIVRRFGLRAGDHVVGPTRPPMDQKNRAFTLVNVEKVNGLSPAEARRITPFESLTPTFPDRRIHLETTQDEVAMRVTNIFTPIGFGQRGLIVAPPRTGKTVLMQKIANSISANHPNAHLIILLIDERPEEVTDMERNTKAHVYSSTFDEPPDRHVQVADIVIEMSRRMVELGKDVVILLDSITRLARAYNTLQPNSGKILSGGVDANALQKPKRFFGAARNIEGGGSLTIIATALVDTGSRMDEVIFEEFKGTGNMELCLDRSLVDKRVFPAINIEKSGTRKEELLLHSEELARTWVLRRALNGVPAVEAMEMIIKRLKNTGTNAEFLMSMKE